MKYTPLVVVLLAGIAIGSVDLRAHHSGSEYARETIELEGTLLEVAWQNPHVHFFVRAKDEKGATVTWDIEANSLSILRRTDATPENLKVGDKVKVAGSPSRRERKRDRARPGHQAALGGQRRRREVDLVRGRHRLEQDGRNLPCVEHEVQ